LSSSLIYVRSNTALEVNDIYIGGGGGVASTTTTIIIVTTTIAAVARARAIRARRGALGAY